jgi:hypothetical protein
LQGYVIREWCWAGQEWGVWDEFVLAGMNNLKVLSCRAMSSKISNFLVTWLLAVFLLDDKGRNAIVNVRNAGWSRRRAVQARGLQGLIVVAGEMVA